IYNVEAGAIQRIATVMGPGFNDPHLTPESIAENYARVESIEGFFESGPFEPGQIPATAKSWGTRLGHGDVRLWQTAVLYELLRELSAAAPAAELHMPSK